MKYARILLFLALSLGLVSVSSADTRRIYPDTLQVDPAGGGASTLESTMVDLLRVLVDDCDGTSYDCLPGAGTTGPGWTIVEVYAGGREVPADPTDVDSIAVETAWSGDGSGLEAGDWFVVESADSTGGGGTNHFQVVFEYDSTSVIKYAMLPLEDWQVGTSTPDAAGTGHFVGAGTGLVSFTTMTGSCKMLIVADEDVVIMLRDDSSSPDILYIGAVDGSLSTSTPPDDRPFVVYDSPEIVYIRQSSGYFNRMAPDDSTVLVAGYPVEYYANTVVISSKAGQYNGSFWLISVPVWFNDESHYHFAGTLQYVREGSKYLGSAGRTINSASWACRGTDSNFSPWCLSWDGVAYP